MAASRSADDSRQPPRDDPASTVVVQTAFLGDVILTIPLLAALAEREGPVDVVTTPAAAPLLQGHPAVSRVIRYDKRGRDRGPAGWLRVVKALREAGYGSAYLPHRSWRSASLALAAMIPERIGFSDSAAAISYTRKVVRDNGLHETRRLLSLSGSDHFAFHLSLDETEMARASDWLRDRGITGQFMALAPGSVWGTKRWPGYPALAAGLEYPVVVLGGPAERAAAEEVVAASGGRAISAAGLTSLRESAAIMAHARVLVTNDSAPLHMAGAVGTAVVAIFGPTVPAFGFGPLGAGDVIVENLGLECRPCSPHGPMKCPLGHHRCMTEVTVERVRQAVLALWRARGAEDAGQREPN